MDQQLKRDFIEKWRKYFNESELPIAFFYSDNLAGAEKVAEAKGRSCLICELKKVREGKSVAYSGEAIACGGAKRYLGYSCSLFSNFNYFLSYGIEGKVEGERYKKSPELVQEFQDQTVQIDAAGKYLVFKRWDNLTASDLPDACIFFANPDVLAGLFTLANFDIPGRTGVITPFGSGCSSIIHFPYLENQSDDPKCVLGMFDPSARKCLPANILTFAVPFKKMVTMVENMDESFLITPSWENVRKRI